MKHHNDLFCPIQLSVIRPIETTFQSLHIPHTQTDPQPNTHPPHTHTMLTINAHLAEPITSNSLHYSSLQSSKHYNTQQNIGILQYMLSGIDLRFFWHHNTWWLSLFVLRTQPSAHLPVRIMEPVHHLVYVTVQMNGREYFVTIVS